ncbi:hypothetical protein BJ322DRAFT_1077015 [Thelephora terrestris]|uniref:Uncharacterized protein n=1 Tax=Thelephora terrestris TaxID=56493 RepID=A0A9P6L3E6_9AGAM|nr:hypothetical protein BJ322DRAFT_1077015 [Thelephora terrestris]
MPPPTSTPASIISDAIASLSRAADAALSKSEERAQAELSRALSDARQAKNQRDEALNSLRAIEIEQVTHKQQLNNWKAAADRADLTIQNQDDTIAQLRQENIHWRDQYVRVEKSCQEWKEQFTRVEQERIRLLARLEELMAQRDSGNVSGLSSDEFALGGEHPTSPPSSSASTKIGSASADKPSTRHRQPEAVFIPHPQRAPAPRKSTGKPPVGGTKTQTKTATNPTRPVKGKVAPRQKPTQNPEGTATKGPTQRVIRRVHAVVEVPIKVEDEEDELGHTLVEDRKGRVPSDRDPRPSTSVKKVSKPGETSRTKSKTLAVYRDEDVTPPAPAPIPKRRKSGVDTDYHEPDEEADRRRGQEDSNVKHRPPSRRKSIRDLRESDFEYREEEDDESDTDELNLGYDVSPEKLGKQQRTNEPSSIPARKTGRKRKVVDAMDFDEPVVSGRRVVKAAKTR